MGRGEVVAGLRHDRDGPAGPVGEVIGVRADRVRLGVGFPIELVVWDPLEDFARACHLVIEFGECVFGVGHGMLRIRGWDWGLGAGNGIYACWATRFILTQRR